MSKDYSEDQLIQKSAADLLENELGWTSVMAWDAEVLGELGTFGRKSYHEVLLTRHFCKALKALNPWMTDKQLAEAVERMTEHMSSQSLMQINEQKYQYIKEGIPVTRTKSNGETEEVKAKVIDFASPEKNEFMCVRELWVYGSLYRRRGDIAGFVNGNISNVGVHYGKINLQAATSKISSFKNISSYTLIGDYDEDLVSWEDKPSSSNSSGSGADFGGTLNFPEIYQRMTYMDKYGYKDIWGSGNNRIYLDNTVTYKDNTDEVVVTTSHIYDNNYMPLVLENLKKIIIKS